MKVFFQENSYNQFTPQGAIYANWVMSCGSARTHFCGYLKWKLFNWITPRDLSNYGVNTVAALASSSASVPRLYRAKLNGAGTEYLLVENRRDGSGAFEDLAGYRDSGLLVTHVDETMAGNGTASAYNDGWPVVKTFYAVEAVVAGLATTITTLDQYAGYMGRMVFSSSGGFEKVTPTFPARSQPGRYLTLTTGDDTEHVIYPNTQGHKAAGRFGILGIGPTGATMQFTYAVPPVAPTNVVASDSTNTNNVQITWQASGYATSYKIFRATTNNTASAKKIGTATQTTFKDTQAVRGITYYYWVKAYNQIGESPFSRSDAGRRR